jgi:hypothetical protein
MQTGGARFTGFSQEIPQMAGNRVTGDTSRQPPRITGVRAQIR